MCGLGKRGAFTLVELLTVVVLLGIIAAVVLPNAEYSDDAKALIAAEKVATDIEYAQSEAVSRRRRVTVSFSTAGETYFLAYNTAGAPEMLFNPATGSFFSVNLPGDLLAAGVDISSADFGNGESHVTFNAFGEPVRSDGSPISSDAGVAIRCGASVYTVSIAPVTGRVIVVPGS